MEKRKLVIYGYIFDDDKMSLKDILEKMIAIDYEIKDLTKEEMEEFDD